MIKRLAIAIVLLLCGGNVALAETWKADGPAPGGGSYVATIAIGKMAEKHLGFQFNFQAGQTGTKSMVKLAQGKIDFTLLPVPAVGLLKGQKAMYKNLSNAAELHANLRGVLVWECCSWHWITYDTDIKTLADVKGKKVYTGPPGSVAKRILEGHIKATAGLQAGTDYTAVNLDWGSGAQALRDGNLDVHVQPAFTGSPIVEELALSREMRMLTYPSVDQQTPQQKKVFGAPGNDLIEIPAGTYKNFVNDEVVTTIALRHIAGVGVHSSEEKIYQLTKMIWENIDEFYGYGSFLKKVNPKLAFKSMNVPLHAGAYKYYKEAGWDVPANLIPPEAK